MSDPGHPASVVPTLEGSSAGSRWGWAAYLGASWTWCIGMFLPVLLIRDYGPWAWVIFAVPNAVGAGAMGWVMRSAAMSRHYAVDHAWACRLFSFVTIAFQLFFSMWMLPTLVGPVGYVGALVLAQSAFTPFTKSSGLRWGGAAVIVASLVIAAGMSAQHAFDWPYSQAIRPGDALGLGLVCFAGFVTCPYLDLTFHRARQSTDDRDARFAFGVGFGVVFASMIVLTFFYAPQTIRIQTSDGGLSTVAEYLLALHLLLQMTYTVHAHAAELASQAGARDDAGVMRAGLGVSLGVGLLLALAATFAQQHGIEVGRRVIVNGEYVSRSRAAGEAGYRVFMAAYGLLFPAYVLLAIRRRRVSTIAWLAITVVATPFYWLAFIEGRMVWAIGGVAVMVLGVAMGRLTPAAPAAPFE